ncbi:hypothetical protein ACLOJK_002527 [Asimina triloba]
MNVGRKPLVCVLAVPNHMTYADFCQFCGSFIQHISEMRIVRNDEVEVCHVLFTVDVQYTGSIEHAQTSIASSMEQPHCPVCLGTSADIASNSLKSQPALYAKQLRISGYVLSVVLLVVEGMLYKEGHAIKHWKETQHCYSLELETQRVWDYVGDNYVHRLIQSKTDGKLVELNFHHANDGCGSCECSADSGISEALFNSKVEAIVNEYNELLTTQLENQRKHCINNQLDPCQYYETLLVEVKEETEREISEAVGKAISSRLQKLQSKLDKCTAEKKFLDEINENLMKNQEIWRAKILKIEEREESAVKLRDEKIHDLEEQLRDLMVYIEGQKTLEQLPNSDEIKEGTVLPIPVESSSSSRSSTLTSRNEPLLKHALSLGAKLPALAVELYEAHPSLIVAAPRAASHVERDDDKDVKLVRVSFIGIETGQNLQKAAIRSGKKQL